MIGGGFAGGMAGLCALLRGAKKVDLFERTHELIPLQHGSNRDTRPFVFEWPNDEVKYISTKSTSDIFPILGWESGPANQVRRDVIDEAVKLCDEVARFKSGNEISKFTERLRWKERVEQTDTLV